MQYAGQSLNTVSSRMWTWNPRRFLSIFRNRIPNFVFGRVDREKQQSTQSLYIFRILSTSVSSVAMPVYLQSCIQYFVSVVMQQSGTRSPQCLLVLLFRLKKRSMYDICRASFWTTKSCSFALGTLTIDSWWFPDDFFRMAGYSIS